MIILVTGGAGFIGSALVRLLLSDSESVVVNVDKLTYAGHLESLQSVESNPRHHFERVDICDRADIERIFADYHPDAIMHLAAESHVDRSIDGSCEFIQTNINGTHSLLEISRSYWESLAPDKRTEFRFVQVSTDEVYGDLDVEESGFSESTRYAPSSPYAASKAAADHLVRAWHRTYDFPVLITNCSNNYGPFQLPEKLIPLITLNALDRKKLPVYGDGKQIRDWLHVDDHARALVRVLKQGKIGETYNIGGDSEMQNIEVVRSICRLVDELHPSEKSEPRENLIQFVADRPGHDRRYAIDAAKIRSELGWQPEFDFLTGTRNTVEWYLNNLDWCQKVNSDQHKGERRGLGKTS